MNKNELVKSIAEKSGLKINETEILLNALIKGVSEELEKGGKITLIGFGTFLVTERKERVGINPKTGQKISIPKKKVPVFKVGKALKEKIQ